MSNGNNVPDDCRYSDYWDDNELTCPVCCESMTISDDNSQAECDSEECQYIIEAEQDDPEPDDEW